MTETHGLFKQRARTCQRCGTVFQARKATATYCSQACRLATSRYGRTYGSHRPRYDGAFRR
jgi:uncharacterized C2H2 Zn-finger protein